MFRRVLAALKKAFTPDWDVCEDPAAFSMTATVTQVPQMGAVLEAAVESKDEQKDPG